MNTLYVPCPLAYLLTDEENGRHPPERVVAHGSEGPAGAAARPARVVQTRQLLLHEGCSREQANQAKILPETNCVIVGRPLI